MSSGTNVRWNVCRGGTYIMVALMSHFYNRWDKCHFFAKGGTNVSFLDIGGTNVDLIEGGTNVR
jgi:hypothetical protein